VLDRLIGGIVTAGSFMAVSELTIADSWLSGSGGVSGRPSDAANFIKALSWACAAAEADAESDAAAEAEAEAEALADAEALAVADALAEAEADADAEALAVALARACAAASSRACNAAAPPGAIRLMPHCVFKLFSIPPSMPRSFSCGISPGRPPGRPGRFAFKELIVALSDAAALALNEAMPIAFRLIANEAMSESFADAEAESPRLADAAAEALADAFISAEAAANTFQAADGMLSDGNAGGSEPCKPPIICEQTQAITAPRSNCRLSNFSVSRAKLNRHGPRLAYRSNSGSRCPRASAGFAAPSQKYHCEQIMVRYARMAWVLVATVGLTAATDEPRRTELPGGLRHLIAAYTYRTTDRVGRYDDEVVLGHYDFLDGVNVEFTYFSYDARRNTQPTPTEIRHPRLVPGATAVPGLFKLPTFTAFQRIRGTWLATEDGTLRLRFGEVIHDWTPRAADEHYYVPAHPYVNAQDGSHVLGETTFSNARGHGYLADVVTLPRRLTRDDLLDDYQGETYSLPPTKTGEPTWIAKPTALHLDRYRAFHGGELWSYATRSDRLSPPAWAFSNFLINQSSYSPLLIYEETGHDFNRNNVYDEFGHTTQLFGVYDGEKVSRLVFVEYSYQTAGYPILTVGRYYRAAGRAAR
jgi:hypothetical protein